MYISASLHLCTFLPKAGVDSFNMKGLICLYACCSAFGLGVP